MKRERDSSGDAAMLGLKAFQRFQRGGIADQHSDLTAFRNIGRLALGRGFGLFHESIKKPFISRPLPQLALQIFEICISPLAVVQNQVVTAVIKALNVAVAVIQKAFCGCLVAVRIKEVFAGSCSAEIGAGLASSLEGFKVHDRLRCVGELYAVTSDASTTAYRVAA